MNTNVQKFSIVKFITLLVCVVGVGQSFALCTDNMGKRTIGGKSYWVIESATDLVCFSDTVNNYVLDKKWQEMVKVIEADETTDGFKDSTIELMKAIRQNTEEYYNNPEKKALWDKEPYKTYLSKAYGVSENIPFYAIVDADFIDMKDIPFVPIASGQGNARFTGVFDGNGVTIKNLSIDSSQIKMRFYDLINGYPTDRQNIGLFGVIGTGGVVKNVILENVSIKATGKNSYWNTSIPQVSVGAIAGWVTDGKIETCFASGEINSDGRDVGVGGIAGSMGGSSVIENCLSDVKIFATGTEKVYVGGIAGVVKENPTISNCVYDGESLEAHPDDEHSQGAQGAIIGRIGDEKKTTGSLKNIETCFYNTNVLSNDVGRIVGTSYTISGVAQGVPEVNTPEVACQLNNGVWSENTCSVAGGIWSNSINITNNGASHDALGNVVYVVTFDANDGVFADGKTKTTKAVRAGEVLTGLGVILPTREGRVFGNWALTADASKLELNPNLGKVYRPQTVYAYWKKNYDITFNANANSTFEDGSKTKKVVYAEGDSISASSIGYPKDYSIGSGENRKDYKCIGWALKNNATESENLGVASANTIIYGVWKETPAVFHTIVFKAQGHGVEPSPVRVEHDSLLKNTYPLSADGYAFGGWNNKDESFSFDKPIISDDTLYAQWTLNEYTITYNLDGGTNHVANLGKYTVESPYIALKDPIKDGFTFLGWYIDDSYSTKVDGIIPGQTVGNVKLNAKWDEITYEIKYVATALKVEGVGNIDPVQKRYNQNVDLLGVTFIAAGYEQDGWAKEDGDENTIKDYALGATYSENKSVKLFPHWKKATYNITYHNVENAVNPNPATYQMDTVNAKTLSNPTMHGWKFDGWYENADLSGSKKSSIEKNKFGDLDLYAKWTPTTITVTATGVSYKYDGNTHGAVVKFTGCPTSLGYTCTAVTDSIKDVSEIPVKINSVTIVYNATGDDVTSSFNIIPIESDSVKVTPETDGFTISLANEFAYYDGEPHAMKNLPTSSAKWGVTNYEYQFDGDGDTWVSNLSTLTKVEKSAYTINVRATNNKYKNPTALASATFEITDKTIITVTANSKSKIYDGSPLSDESFTYAGVKDGDILTVSAVTGTITNVGSVANMVGEVTVTRGGSNVTDEYEINKMNGTLEVTPKSAIIKVDEKIKLYGDAEPGFTGTITGLVDDDDLGVVTYYRTNPSEKNAGVYNDEITASFTPNSNYDVTVTPAKYTINKRNVTLTSATATKVYDGSALTANDVTIGGDGFASNEGIIPTVTGSQIDAGTSKNMFTYKLKDGTDTLTNYNISGPYFGDLTVNKSPVTISITGHANSYVYTGAEQKIYGYDVTIDNTLYKSSYFKFNKTENADSIAAGVNVGTYKMGLTKAMFTNNNPNFSETFIVTDGSLVITPMSIEVGVRNTNKIFGNVDPDFKQSAYATGFSENEPLETFFDKCIFERTPGEDVGTYMVSIKSCSANANYAVTIVPSASNNFKITKRSLRLTVSAEKTYGEPDPTACTAVISCFVNGETATVNDCTITSRTVAGENIGSYLITATINTSDIKWGTTNKDNYTVESGTGLLKINPKEITVTANKASKEYGDPDPTFTYKIEGLVDGDSENLISATITRPSPAGNPLDDDPGEYPISITGEANQGNYKVSFVGSTLEILVENAVIAYWKIGENGSLEKSIIVPIAKSDTTMDQRIISKIRNAITKNHIEPEKAADEDSTYTYNRNWEKIEKGKYKALFRGIAKKTDIIIKYGKNNADTIVATVEVPRTRDEALISEDIDKALKSRNKEAVKETDNDSTYHVDHWTKNSDGIYEPVFKGTTLTTTIYVSYSDNKYDILPMDIDVHVLPDRNNDSLVWSKAINQVMDSLDLTPTKAGYEFSGIWKSVKNDNYPNGYFEPVFMTKSEVEQLVEKIVVRYGEQPKDTLVLEVPIAASEAHIVTMINDTLTARNITPSKAADGEYGYTFDGTWAKNPTTKQYEPGFTKSKIKEIVVKYGDSDKDTVHVQINESDTDSIIEKKIEAVIIPTKEADSTHVYEFQKFVYNEDTQVYEPSFEYKARMFSVNFNLPSEGELLAEFKGYVYGVVTKLPGARIKSDTTWEFKGWYEKTNGLGERYKAMRATDYGDKDVYPLFQKTVSYDANGNKGAIVVIYSGTAERAINRALAGVIPEDYTKGEKTYTFKEWKQENGVYKAEMTSIPYVRKAVPRFSVTVADRALEISGASIGKTLTVFDMQGRVIVNEQIARGTHRVELAHPGNYIVRVNNQNITVNVK